MGALGKLKREHNLDAGGLAGMLANERSAVVQRAPGIGTGLMDLLDADDDGQILDDLAKLGGKGLLGKLFK